jgi:hypothetical protein
VDDDCDGLVDCPDSDCCVDGLCAGPDADGDGFELCDCDDGNPSVWSPPSEVLGLALAEDDPGTTLDWDPPSWLGATSVTYEVLRSGNPANLVGSTVCLPDADPGDTTLLDPATPGDDAAYYYEIRAVNACPQGNGPLGRDSNNIPREGHDCP